MSVKIEATHRVNLEDLGQLLTWIDIEISPESELGIIAGVPEIDKPEFYINKAVDMDEIIVGERFRFANPAKGFTVTVLPYEVESIEPINHQTA